MRTAGWVWFEESQEWRKALLMSDGKVYRNVGLYVARPGTRPVSEKVAETFAVNPWADEPSAPTEER